MKKTSRRTYNSLEDFLLWTAVQTHSPPTDNHVTAHKCLFMMKTLTFADGWLGQKMQICRQITQKEDKNVGFLGAGEPGVMGSPRTEVLLSSKLYCKCLHSYIN